jgi:multiple sugar transport system ATP-binding protein
VPIDRWILARAGDDKTLTLGIRSEAFQLADEGLPVKEAVE